jgi:hypothetical protein
MFRITVSTSDIRRHLLDLEGDLQNAALNALEESTAAAAAHAKATRLFEDRTTGLRGSIEAQPPTAVVGRFAARLAARANYASFVENGTPPHVIEARGGGMLRFVINGTPIFRKRVFHPGTKPRPFMEEASFVGHVTLHNALESGTDRAIARFNAR